MANRGRWLLTDRTWYALAHPSVVAQAIDLKVTPSSSATVCSAPRTLIRRVTGARLQLMARVDHGAYRFEDLDFQTWVAARRNID